MAGSPEMTRVVKLLRERAEWINNTDEEIIPKYCKRWQTISDLAVRRIVKELTSIADQIESEARDANP